MRPKIFDCITFFQENMISNIRFEILDNSVDHFVVCESKYDHKGKKKNLNFTQMIYMSILRYQIFQEMICKKKWELLERQYLQEQNKM